MNTIQRIAKNTGVLLVANVISRIPSFSHIMHTARYLGTEGFGVLSVSRKLLPEAPPLCGWGGYHRILGK